MSVTGIGLAAALVVNYLYGRSAWPRALPPKHALDQSSWRHPVHFHWDQLLAGPLRAVALKIPAPSTVPCTPTSTPRCPPTDSGGHLLPGRRPLVVAAFRGTWRSSPSPRGCHRCCRAHPGRCLSRPHRVVPRAPQPTHPRIPYIQRNIDATWLPTASTTSTTRRTTTRPPRSRPAT